jgi:hypothetical protein
VELAGVEVELAGVEVELAGDKKKKGDQSWSPFLKLSGSVDSPS